MEIRAIQIVVREFTGFVALLHCFASAFVITIIHHPSVSSSPLLFLRSSVCHLENYFRRASFERFDRIGEHHSLKKENAKVIHQTRSNPQ